jgi:hypothetical protein
VLATILSVEVRMKNFIFALKLKWIWIKKERMGRIYSQVKKDAALQQLATVESKK